MTPDPIPILYACVAKGPTVLAELSATDAGGDGDGGLSSLAARCLEAAPRFHRLYTHTAGGRIYAFLMEEPLVFFAVANEALGRPQALVFLRRLCDAFSSSSATFGSRRVGGPDPLSPLCFQDEFLPVLRRLMLPLPSHEDKPPPPPPLYSPPSDAPLTAGTPSEPEDSRRERQKKSKKVKKKRNEEAESRMEIAVPADDDDADGNGGRKTAQRTWRRHVWTILLIDLVVCTLFFAVWLSVCRGFQCIAG